MPLVYWYFTPNYMTKLYTFAFIGHVLASCQETIDIYTWIAWFNVWLGLGSSYLEDILIPFEPHFTLHSSDTSLLTAPYLRSTTLTEFALGEKGGC